MTLISISEQSTTDDGWTATVAFDNGPRRTIRVRDPFSPAEEKRLEWYFEQHIRFPFTDGVKAQEAAQSVTAYGTHLFEQVFSADHEIYRSYANTREQGIVLKDYIYPP